MPAWPAILPLPALPGYKRRAPRTKIRTEMDAGPAKQRRRFTAAPSPVTWPVPRLSREQAEALIEFHDETLKGGTLRFDAVERLTRKTVAMRFVEEPEPELGEDGWWHVELKLEVMP